MEEKSGPQWDFTRRLLAWDRQHNRRALPWKGEADPYRIWLSEIILQQTRVEQGRSYYEAFIKAFPTIRHLAAAPEADVFKLWEGLGYYSRARNLIHTARFIAQEHGGRFPDTYEAILALKGVGPYTAAAIASFAFNLPHAVLDGNVFRVLARIFGQDLPTDSAEGKKWFAARAQLLLDTGRPAAYNQAIMDFGATVCKPVPDCASCFFRDACTAYAEGRQAVLPVKAKRTAVRTRYFNYVVLRNGNQVAVRQRTAKDIWQDLYEFLLLETPEPVKADAIREQLAEEYGIDAAALEPSGAREQRLTHQLVHFTFYTLHFSATSLPAGLAWVPLPGLEALAFPRTLQQFAGVLLDDGPLFTGRKFD